MGKVTGVAKGSSAKKVLGGKKPGPKRPTGY